MRNGEFGGSEYLLQQQRHGLIIGIQIQLFQTVRRTAMARIVPQNIQLPEMTDGLVHQRLQLVHLRHIAMHKQDFVIPEALLQGMPLLILNITRDDSCASRNKGLDPRQTNTACRAGDDCNLA